MRHLINAALKYEDLDEDQLPDGDGIECLTDFERFNIDDNRRVVAVHLPYCTDWYGVWSGKREWIKGFDDSTQNYMTYGRSREEIVNNLADAIMCASELHPAYAILHAGSANIDELFSTDYSETNEEVLLSFCDMMNQVFHRLDGMPVRLMFENQWWPGLTFLNRREFEILEDNLEFNDWGYCLDTGHLLVATKRASDEASNIELLKDIILEIPSDVRERIEVIHLHNNSSEEYIREFDRASADAEKDLEKRIRKGYDYVVGMDEHRSFTLPECRGIIDMVSPFYLVHEMGASEGSKKISDYMCQRSLFQ